MALVWFGCIVFFFYQIGPFVFLEGWRGFFLRVIYVGVLRVGNYGNQDMSGWMDGWIEGGEGLNLFTSDS